MLLEKGQTIEERNPVTGELIKTYTIDTVGKNFAYSGVLQFPLKPVEGTEHEFKPKLTFRDGGKFVRVLTKDDCGGTCEKCTCQ